MSLPTVIPISSESVARPAAAPITQVRRAERLLDVLALSLIAGGSTVFLIARRALIAISAGTYTLPAGTTWVGQTDYHVAQSKVGLTMAGVGIALGLAVAARYAWRAGQEEE